MKYKVLIREVHIQPYSVEAEDEKEAKAIVSNGEGSIIEEELEYSHTLDPETWTVEKENE